MPSDTSKGFRSRTGALTLTALVLMALASFTLSFSAAAQGRDRALESVRSLTTQLIERTEGQASDDRVWAGVQALTDAMRRFVLSETEIRAQEKVGVPPIASLRPGQELTESSSTPGDQTELEEVPTSWFNAQATKAQEALEQVRSGVEDGVQRPELAARLRAVLSALNDVDRPPA